MKKKIILAFTAADMSRLVQEHNYKLPTFLGKYEILALAMDDTSTNYPDLQGYKVYRNVVDAVSSLGEISNERIYLMSSVFGATRMEKVQNVQNPTSLNGLG